MAPLSAQRRWRIVLARDARYDGAFVYAVRSTRVFCRPSCPSRRPRRAQVMFFDQPSLAASAGFRPCRRCRPLERSADPHAAAVYQACRIIDAHPEAALDLAALAQRSGTSPPRLVRAFRRLLAVTPRQYRDERRLDRFKRRLKETQRVNPALYDAGFSSPSRVYERSHAHLGMTPASYAHGGRGASIRYVVVDCPLGCLLVAATPRGICRISIGADRRTLERQLVAEFPNATIGRNHAGLKASLSTLAAYWRGSRSPAAALPLDVHATAFQRAVWEMLRRIPYGSTWSYSALARKLGMPRGARAVARACATNPIALLVPCHRVVRTDGALGGYRWGLERKEALLARERAAAGAASE